MYSTSTAEEETIMTIENEEVQTTGTQKAYFAGGCFWCMEPPFEAMEGVLGATSGYMGGTMENPTYEDVVTGETGHAEVVEICSILMLSLMKSSLKYFGEI